MTRQLITFQIDDKLLGVDIMAVREIRVWTPTTKIPHAPAYVRGVVNLRGTVLPVIDLSSRLGWGDTEASARHVIIVMEIGHQLHGLIVDSVNDIVLIDEATMQPPPDLGDPLVPFFIEGLATVDDHMAMVLDLKSLTLGATPPAATAAQAPSGAAPHILADAA
jgi:purine-binding chemotaxis protein CheW